MIFSVFPKLSRMTKTCVERRGRGPGLVCRCPFGARSKNREFPGSPHARRIPRRQSVLGARATNRDFPGSPQVRPIPRPESASRGVNGHNNPSLRAGLTLTEVLIVLALAATVFLVLLMAIPRAREQARLVGCRRNLGQIGMALALYDQFQNHLPQVGLHAGFDDQSPAADAGATAGPLRTLLESLALPDFTELTDRKKAPQPRPGEVPGETAVPGFVCQSDPSALAGRFLAPVSYRAATGDSPDGNNGPFAPGRSLALSAIEAADGLSYTAGFSERLVGDRENGIASLAAYQLVPDRVSPTGCPPPVGRSVWRGDAGSSWRIGEYRSTLYNHALVPGGRPSCIARDGQTASMGASSGHTRGVNMLRLDGSVTLVVPTINPKVWKEFAAIGSGER